MNAGTDPLSCALALVRADNERDLVRYHALLADGFHTEAEGTPVALSADEDAAATARAWAAHPDARIVVEDAEVVGGFVLLRYRLVEGDRERSASSVLEVRDGKVRRAWRYRAPVAADSGPDARARRPWTIQRVVKAVAVVLALVAYTIYDELLFSTPVVVTSLAVGAIAAFVVFTVVYSVGGFLVTLLVLHHYHRSLAGRPGRVERWLTHAATSPRWRWLTGALVAGRVPAFLVASYALGPIVTMWALRSAGATRDLTLLTAASTLCWSIPFVAGYAGLGALLG